MIKLLTEYKKPDIISFCRDDAFGAVIRTRLFAYGHNCSDAMFWYQENEKHEINAVLSLFDGVLTVCPLFKAEDEEIIHFASVIGAQTITKEAKFTLIYTDGISDLQSDDITGENVRDVFSVIFEDDENRDKYFSKWYTDISHKIRHGLIHGKCVYSDGICVSAALTSGETETTAVISSVATLKSHRRKGFGERVVVSLAESLKKNVLLMTNDEKTKEWYIKIGFTRY